MLMGAVRTVEEAWEDAERYLEKALSILTTAYGEQHPRICAVMNHMAGLRHRRGDSEGAAVLFEESLAQHRAVLPPSHPQLGRALKRVAEFRLEQGNLSGAELAARESLKIAQSSFPPGHTETLGTVFLLAHVLIARSAFSEAEKLLLETCEAASGSPGSNEVMCKEQMAELYDSWGKPEKAAEYRDLQQEEEDGALDGS
jgi:hypothetical protein